ncbi:MAG: hypothetical protein ABIJ95_05110, partial [Pseudomonadota bacterium]
MADLLAGCGLGCCCGLRRFVPSYRRAERRLSSPWSLALKGLFSGPQNEMGFLIPAKDEREKTPAPCAGQTRIQDIQYVYEQAGQPSKYGILL